MTIDAAANVDHSLERRRQVMRAWRPRGIYIPINEVRFLHDLCAWEIIDSHPGPDEVLMRPPAERRA